ncbi:flagellar hook-length control protein FliK [Paracoccus jeotgali]|uniref:flagellar hook-length control protein FliK n=1 Tax=Paracoccus jeotgali TaxID=2065379 RepID=UPI0028B267FE|nr:flagellar hook-length control protein FliK [Paracoccus jeotgali]
MTGQNPLNPTILAEKQLESLAGGPEEIKVDTPVPLHTRRAGAARTAAIPDMRSANRIEALQTAQTPPQPMRTFVAPQPRLLQNSSFSVLKQAVPFRNGPDTTLLEKSVALGEAETTSGVIPTFTPSHVTAANTTAPVHQQIASALVAATPDSPETELLLAPEELGKLRFVFGKDDGALTILITAERPETLQLLRRNADSLIQNLNQLGLTDATIDFGDGSSRDRDHPAAKGGPSDTDPLAVQQVPAQPTDKPPMPLRFGRLELRL